MSHSSRARAAARYLTTPLRRQTSTTTEPTTVREDQSAAESSTAPRDERLSQRRTQARLLVSPPRSCRCSVVPATAFVGRLLTQYVGPLFAAASADLGAALGTGHGDRALFKSAAGGGSPDWEILLILASAVGWCLILVPSLFSVIFKRSVRGGPFRFLPAVVAAIYPISLLANISAGSKLVAERAHDVHLLRPRSGRCGVARDTNLEGASDHRAGCHDRGGNHCLPLGSLLFGIGPLVSLLPGPYRVGADELSLGSPSLAVAHWTNSHLPAGSHVAADRDNAPLLNAIGGVDPVTPQSGLINPELLWFDHPLSLYDIYLIRKADIRYIVIDDRLTQGLPLYGTYVAEGEPSTRLTLGDLNKYDSYPFIKRIYDNGPIQVYDLTELLPPSYRAAPAGPPVGGTGVDVGVLILAVAVAGSWLLRLRRRPEPRDDLAHLALCGVVGALVILVFGAFLVRLTHAQPEATAMLVLLALLVLSLCPRGWHPRDLAAGIRRRRTETIGPSTSLSSVAPSPSEAHADPRERAATGRADPASSTRSAGTTTRRVRPQVVLGGLGVLVFALGASLATVSSLNEWTPPAELSIASRPPDLSVVGTPGAPPP